MVLPTPLQLYQRTDSVISLLRNWAVTSFLYFCGCYTTLCQCTCMGTVTPKHTDILLFALIADPADPQPTVGTNLVPDIGLHRGKSSVCRRFRYPCAM